MSKPKHPMQPVVLDEAHIARFKENPIVRYLLDNGGIDMNHLAAVAARRMPGKDGKFHRFSDDDRAQFAQLIGYSVSGYSSLPYVTDENYKAATRGEE